MQISKYMCPPGSYYDMRVDACIAISPHAYRSDVDFPKIEAPPFPGEQPKEVPPELIEEVIDDRVVKKQPKISPNQAVAKEIAMRSIKPAI